jgi:hypothetical protein
VYGVPGVNIHLSAATQVGVEGLGGRAAALRSAAASLKPAAVPAAAAASGSRAPRSGAPERGHSSGAQIPQPTAGCVSCVLSRALAFRAAKHCKHDMLHLGRCMQMSSSRLLGSSDSTAYGSLGITRPQAIAACLLVGCRHACQHDVRDDSLCPC